MIITRGFGKGQRIIMRGFDVFLELISHTGRDIIAYLEERFVIKGFLKRPK